MGYAGPIAAALILILIAAVVTWRLEYSRVAALNLSARLLDLRAGELVRELDSGLDASPQAGAQTVLAEAFSRDPDAFGAAHPDFVPAPIALAAGAARVSLLPQELDANGMFIAAWRRLP